MESQTCSKKKNRLSYSIMFKLAAVCFAETNGNRATARYLGINEKQIRDWRSKKHYLLQCDANAKRLKGAGRYPIRFKYNYREGGKDLSPYGNEGDKMIGYKEMQTRNQFETIGQQNKEQHGSSDKNFRRILPAVNVQDGHGLIKSETIINKRFSDVKFKPKRESDFNERISCALALLDLQASRRFL